MPTSTSWRTAAAAALLALAAVPAAAAEIDPEADAILRRMTDYLAGLAAFSVTSDSSTEILLADGRKIQLTATGRASLDRALGFRAERHGPIGPMRVHYDGDAVTVHAVDLNAYTTIPIDGSNDAALDEVRAVLGAEAAGGVDLLYAEPYDGLLLEVESGEYLGRTVVGGVPVDHLSYRASGVDWQLWVQAEGDPLPVKYVITSKWTTAAPQFSVQLSDWDLDESFAAIDFAFTAPQGSRMLTADELYTLATGG